MGINERPFSDTLNVIEDFLSNFLLGCYMHTQAHADAHRTSYAFIVTY
jgi:hypothetical protein